MPQTGTQTCTDQQSERIFIAFGESSKRMPKAAAAADDRVDQGSLWRKAAGAAAGVVDEVREVWYPRVSRWPLRRPLRVPPAHAALFWKMLGDRARRISTS